MTERELPREVEVELPLAEVLVAWSRSPQQRTGQPAETRHRESVEMVVSTPTPIPVAAAAPGTPVAVVVARRWVTAQEPRSPTVTRGQAVVAAPAG